MSIVDGTAVLPWYSVRPIAAADAAIIEWIASSGEGQPSEDSRSRTATTGSRGGRTEASVLSANTASNSQSFDWARHNRPPAPRLSGCEPELPLDTLLELGNLQLPPPLHRQLIDDSDVLPSSGSTA
jgi:hypothetical protein